MLDSIHSFTSKVLFDTASASETTDTSLLSTISLICFILAGVMFAVLLFLFFYLRIPRVISDLSGRTAKKSIQRMRYRNENSGKKSHSTSRTNKERGKITNAIPKNAENNNSKAVKANIPPASNTTEKLSDNMNATEPLRPNAGPSKDVQETMPLHPQNITEILQESNATTLLPVADEAEGKVKKWKIIDEVVLIHTDEAIS